MHYRYIVIFLIAGLLATGISYAQYGGGGGGGSDGGGENEGKNRQTKQTEKLSQPVYEKILAAQEAMDDGQPAKALELLDTLTEDTEGYNDYEKGQIYTVYAAVYYEQGETESAIAQYKKIMRLEKAPEQMKSSSLFRLAQLHFVIEDYESAVRILDEWMSRVEGVRPEAHMLKAQAYYQLGQYVEAEAPAIEAMKEARRRGNEIKENWLALLRAVYYEQGDIKKATRVLNALIKRFPKAEYYKQMAGMFGLLDMQEAQAAVMHAAYRSDMLSGETDILNLARLYMAQDAPFPAVEVLKEALRNGDVAVKAENLQLLAQAMAMSKNYTSQIPVLKKAAELSGEAKPYLYLGQAHMAAYEWDKAAFALQKALDIGGLEDRASVYMQLGTAYYNLRDYGGARGAFREAAKFEDYSEQASQWLQFVNREVERQEALRQM